MASKDLELLTITGDGIGPEIMGATKLILNTALKKIADANVTFREIDLSKVVKYDDGGNLLKYFDNSSDMSSEVKLILSKKRILKGPTTTPVGKGAKSINVALRQAFDLYSCVRPVEWFDGVPSPVKHPENVNITVFRENTEDLYSGIEFKYSEDDAFLSKYPFRFKTDLNIALKPISKNASQRLVRSAIKYAINKGYKTVTLVHKGNILKLTEGGFLNWGLEVARSEFDGKEDSKGNVIITTKNGCVKVDSCIADNFFQQALLNPEKFGVVATTNLNGDYISDALAAQVGGIGFAPGANINYETSVSVYEATHGSAPDIAGKNMANPMSLVFSSLLMLEDIGFTQVADRIKKVIKSMVKEGFVTSDFYSIKVKNGEKCTLLGTSEFAKMVVDKL